MNGPSPHLSWKELACKDGIPYPDTFKQDGRIYVLAQVFEGIRELCGDFPIKVLSAYRTPEWNKIIRGAKNSQHIQGRALDLAPPKYLTVNQFYSLIYVNAKEFGIRGLGRYPTSVHVDIRLGPRLVIWSGSGAKDATNIT